MTLENELKRLSDFDDGDFVADVMYLKRFFENRKKGNRLDFRRLQNVVNILTAVVAISQNINTCLKKL